jgi:hypothetical protein
MDEQIVIDSQAYLRGNLPTNDYKAILYRLLSTTRNPAHRQLASAILASDSVWLTTLARNIVKAGE